MKVCNIEQNKELAQSIGNYLNASIKNALESNTTYKLVPIIKEIYDIVNEGEKDPVKALGVAAVVPELFLQVLKLKPEYLSQLLESGFKMDPVYDFIKELSVADDSLDVTAKILKVGYSPTISQINQTSTEDKESTISLIFSDSLQAVSVKLLTTHTFFASSGNNRKSINQSDSDLNFNYKILQNLLKAQTAKDPTFESVEYGGHSGFKFNLMFATNVPNPEKNLAGIDIIPENYVQVIVDNDGNYLYFDENFKVTTEDKGKMVAFPQRNWNKASTKELFIESYMRAMSEIIRKENPDPAKAAVIIADAKKYISDIIDKEIEKLNSHLDDIRNNKPVLSNIIGGNIGAITDPSTLTQDDQGKKLTSEQKAQLEAPLSKFNISPQSLRSILTLYNSIIFDNYNKPIPIKGTLLADKNPGLLDTLIDLLTEDLIENDAPVLAARKKMLFHQFTYPKNVIVNDINGILDIKVKGQTLNLAEKEQAKAILKEVLSEKINGGYFAVMKAQSATNTYEDITISGNNLTTKKSEYLGFISQYMIPRIIYDKTTGGPMVINGFLSYELIKSEEQDKKETQQIIKKANDATGNFDAGNIDVSGFDRSRLLENNADIYQKAAASKWEKTSAVVNAKDSVTGKPLFPKRMLMNIVNSDAFATFSRAGFTLYNGSDSTHMYHEAWHAFSQIYLTKRQRDELYKAATTLEGSFTVLKKVGGPGVNNVESVTLKFKDLDSNNPQHRLYLEEFIAEEFRTYAMNGGKFKVKNDRESKFKKFFRAVYEALRVLFRGLLPSNVYSNPGSQGVLSEVFNVLYTAKNPSELNAYQPTFDNAEFGTLNSGAIYDTEGKLLLYPTEVDLLKRSMDGIISVTINKLILQNKAYGAAFEIFKNPKWIKNVYNNVIKEQLKQKTEELTKKLETLNDKIKDEKDELKKAVLQSDADIIRNNVTTLSKALTHYGNIDGIIDNKVSENSIIAYHLNNSAFKDIIQSAIQTKDENDKSPSLLDILQKTGGVNANEVEASKLATVNAVYLISSLVKEKFDAGQRVLELNELGFPEPIQYRPFFNFLIQKVGGEQSVSRLYQKLVDLKKLKISPLVDQLLDKLSNPSEVMKDVNASRMWLALTASLDKYRTELINTRFTTEKGVTKVVTGKVSAPYFGIKNDIWPSKFSLDSSIFVKVNEKSQNTINLKEVYKKFLTSDQNEEGLVFYKLNSKVKPSDFLSAIGMYLSDPIESENRLQDPKLLNDLNYIYDIIGHAYKNDTEITDIVKFLSKKNTLKGEKIIDGKSQEVNISFSSQNRAINSIAQIEADLGVETSNQMVPTSDNEIQSVFSQNSSFTRIGYALNSANNSKEFGDVNSEFGYVPHLHPLNNPSAQASVVLNSLFDQHSKDKNKDNKYDIDVISGAQHEIITHTDSGIDRVIDGTASKNLTDTDRFVRDIASMLQAGYIEGVANGDKSTFVSGKPKLIRTYTGKNSGHLFIDTETFIIDNDGNWFTNVNPKLEVFNIMIPKLEGEMKRIKMYQEGISDELAMSLGLKEGQGKDFYKKHVAGFENADRFDFFEDVLESNLDIDIKGKLLNEYLPQLSDTITLADLLNKDVEFKRVLYSEIYNYFKAQADQIKEQDYQKIFGNKLPDFLKEIVTENIKDKSLLNNVSVQSLIDAALMSFAVNSTLHTEEQFVIEYGNGYEFNHAKDEFSKRTSPYNSPGRIAPSDEIAIAMLNIHTPRAYEAKRIKEGKVNKKEARGFTRIGNKAVMQESIVKSSNYKMYHDLFKKTLIERGIPEDSRQLEVLLYGEKDGKVGTYDNPVGGAMEAWAAIKNADGAGWVTFDFYRALKWSEDNWSDAQEEAYQKEVRGEHISPKELEELFPVLKQGYAGSLALDNKKNNGKGILPIQSIDKFALIPLVPSLIKDSPWEIIHDKLMEQDTDYTEFVSAAKRSFVKSNVKDANGNIAEGDPVFIPGDSSQLDPRFISGEITFTKNPFFMEYLKNQTEVNKEFKEEGTLSTQYRKIFDLGLYKGGVPVDVDISPTEWKKLSTTEKEKVSSIHKKVRKVFTELENLVKQMGVDLLDEMGWKEEAGELVGKPEDLITYLRKRLSSQGGYTEDQLAILDLSKPSQAEEDEEEFPDLSVSAAASRLEKFLFSIVNNKMIRLKVTGEPLVQAPNVGLQKFRSKLTEEEKQKYTDKNLPGYIIHTTKDPVTGKIKDTIGCGVKVAITENYSNLYKTAYYTKDENGNYVKDGIIAVYKKVLDKEGKPILSEKTKKPVKVLDDEASLARLNEMIRVDAWLDSDQNREKIMISGLRIPGQSPNSTEFGQIYEFLPAAASNIIIIPAEVIAKAGGDFDVDKLNTYIKFITRYGTLLENTMSLEEVDKELKEVEAVLKARKADKLNIESSLDKFRKAIYKISKRANLSDEQIKNFTTRDYKKLLTQLSDEKAIYFLKNNKAAKAAYNIYEKEIKGVTSQDYDGISDVLESLYSSDSELFYYIKRQSDLKDYKNNYAQVIMNSLIGAIINVQKTPELAFSLMLPNGTYLVKPYADELKPIIQKIDNLPNFNLSIKTGKPIKGRDKGVSPTRAREYLHNKNKRQGNLDAKNSLGIIALEIPLNGILNKIGAELEPTITEYIKVPDQKGLPVPESVTSNISIKLPHNYTEYLNVAKKIRAISVSQLLTADKINQIADILSQFTNGAVDAAKDNWIAYLQGNKEGITKILVMLEMGVPIANIAYFINNPLIRKYIDIKRNSKSNLLNVYEKYNPDNYNDALFKDKYAIGPALMTPKGNYSRYSTTSFWGINNMLNGYMQAQKLDKSIFDVEDLKRVAYSSINTADNDIKSRQIAGFLQYLYIEKLVKPFETIKKGIDLDTNTNVDSQTIYSKSKMIEAAEEEPILGKKTLKAIKDESMLAMFYPVLTFAKKLFGPLLRFRTNPKLEEFIYNIETTKSWSIKNATGYDEESFGNKFKNAISLHAFTNELKQYKEGGSMYKGTPIIELFNDQSLVKSIDEVVADYTNNNYIYDAENSSSFFARGFFPISPAAIDGLTANDFVEIILEREFLRKKAMPFTPMLEKSRHFQSIKKDLKNTPLGETLSQEDITRWAYEKLILNEALLNTFNYWQMFSSPDYTVADKFHSIKKNYPELSPLYKELLDRITPDSLRDITGNLISKNLTIKAHKQLDQGLSSQLNVLWKELATSGLIKKAKELKNAESDKYVSNFFEQLPIFLFLQSGLNSSKFSFNSIMPNNNYTSIMKRALKNFEKQFFTGKPQDKEALQGFFNLFMSVNLSSLKERRNRGENYRRTKNQLLELSSVLNVYTQPYIRPTDNSRVFLLDPTYTDDGVKKQVTKEMINKIRKAWSTHVVFLLNDADLGITPYSTTLYRFYGDPETIKNQITLKINEALATGKGIIINSEGFGQNLISVSILPTQAPEDTDESNTCSTPPF